MAFIPFQGKIQSEQFQLAASTVASNGDALTFSSGYVVPVGADNTTPTVGVYIGNAVVAGDSDYASAKAVSVVMATPDLVFLADVGTGSATIANVGVAYDFTDHGSVDLGATDHKNVTVVGVISASKVLVKFNSAYEFVNVS